MITNSLSDVFKFIFNASFVLGIGDHIEIWDQKKYAEYEASVKDEFENIAETIND